MFFCTILTRFFFLVGSSHLYRGSIRITATGEACAKWSSFSDWLGIRMRKAQDNIEKIKRQRGVFNFPQEDAIDLSIIKAANDTRKAMEEQGSVLIVSL